LSGIFYRLVSGVCFFVSGLGIIFGYLRIVSYKHEAVDGRWFDGCEGDFDRVSHKEADLIGGFDFEFVAVGGLALGEILIELGLVLGILEVMSVNLDINFTYNDINF
jgi:hypothetical protein